MANSSVSSDLIRKLQNRYNKLPKAPRAQMPKKVVNVLPPKDKLNEDQVVSKLLETLKPNSNQLRDGTINIRYPFDKALQIITDKFNLSSDIGIQRKYIEKLFNLDFKGTDIPTKFNAIISPGDKARYSPKTTSAFGRMIVELSYQKILREKQNNFKDFIAVYQSLIKDDSKQAEKNLQEFILELITFGLSKIYSQEGLTVQGLNQGASGDIRVLSSKAENVLLLVKSRAEFIEELLTAKLSVYFKTLLNETKSPSLPETKTVTPSLAPRVLEALAVTALAAPLIANFANGISPNSKPTQELPKSDKDEIKSTSSTSAIPTISATATAAPSNVAESLQGVTVKPDLFTNDLTNPVTNAVTSNSIQEPASPPPVSVANNFASASAQRTAQSPENNIPTDDNELPGAGSLVIGPKPIIPTLGAAAILIPVATGAITPINLGVPNQSADFNFPTTSVETGQSISSFVQRQIRANPEITLPEVQDTYQKQFSIPGFNDDFALRTAQIGIEFKAQNALSQPDISLILDSKATSDIVSGAPVVVDNQFISVVVPAQDTYQFKVSSEQLGVIPQPIGAVDNSEVNAQIVTIANPTEQSARVTIQVPHLDQREVSITNSTTSAPIATKTRGANVFARVNSHKPIAAQNLVQGLAPSVGGVLASVGSLGSLNIIPTSQILVKIPASSPLPKGQRILPPKGGILVNPVSQSTYFDQSTSTSNFNQFKANSREYQKEFGRYNSGALTQPHQLNNINSVESYLSENDGKRIFKVDDETFYLLDDVEKFREKYGVAPLKSGILEASDLADQEKNDVLDQAQRVASGSLPASALSSNLPGYFPQPEESSVKTPEEEALASIPNLGQDKVQNSSIDENLVSNTSKSENSLTPTSNSESVETAYPLLATPTQTSTTDSNEINEQQIINSNNQKKDEPQNNIAPFKRKNSDQQSVTTAAKLNSNNQAESIGGGNNLGPGGVATLDRPSTETSADSTTTDNNQVGNENPNAQRLNKLLPKGEGGSGNENNDSSYQSQGQNQSSNQSQNSSLRNNRFQNLSNKIPRSQDLKNNVKYLDNKFNSGRLGKRFKNLKQDNKIKDVASKIRSALDPAAVAKNAANMALNSGARMAAQAAAAVGEAVAGLFALATPTISLLILIIIVFTLFIVSGIKYVHCEPWGKKDPGGKIATNGVITAENVAFGKENALGATGDVLWNGSSTKITTEAPPFQELERATGCDTGCGGGSGATNVGNIDLGNGNGAVTTIECQELKKYLPYINEASQMYGIPAELIAGFLSRETRVGTIIGGCAGYGDSGHGHGLGQADDESWFANRGPYQPVGTALTAKDKNGKALIWSDCRDGIVFTAFLLDRNASSFENELKSKGVQRGTTEFWRQIANTYNSGKVCAIGTDNCTTGRDYGKDVLGRAADVKSKNCLSAGAPAVASNNLEILSNAQTVTKQLATLSGKIFSGLDVNAASTVLVSDNSGVEQNALVPTPQEVPDLATRLMMIGLSAKEAGTNGNTSNNGGHLGWFQQDSSESNVFAAAGTNPNSGFLGNDQAQIKTFLARVKLEGQDGRLLQLSSQIQANGNTPTMEQLSEIAIISEKIQRSGENSATVAKIAQYIKSALDKKLVDSTNIATAGTSNANSGGCSQCTSSPAPTSTTTPTKTSWFSNILSGINVQAAVTTPSLTNKTDTANNSDTVNRGGAQAVDFCSRVAPGANTDAGFVEIVINFAAKGGLGLHTCYATIWQDLTQNYQKNPTSPWGKLMPGLESATAGYSNDAYQFNDAMQRPAQNGKKVYQSLGLNYVEAKTQKDIDNAPVGAIMVVGSYALNTSVSGDINVKTGPRSYRNYGNMDRLMNNPDPNSAISGVYIYYP